MREPPDYSNYRNRRTDVIWLNEALDRSNQTIKELRENLDTAENMVRQMRTTISNFSVYKATLEEETRKKLQVLADKLEQSETEKGNLLKENEELKIKNSTLENAFKSITTQKEQEPKKEEPSLTIPDSTDEPKEILLKIIRENNEIVGLKVLAGLFNKGKTDKVSNEWVRKLVEQLEGENKVKVEREKGKQSIYRVVPDG